MAATTPLTAPDDFFTDPPEWGLRASTALGLVVGGFVLVALSFYLVGQGTAELVSGTVVVENPAYPGDLICDAPSGTTAPDGCSEPATHERSYSALVAEGFWSTGQTLALLLVGGFVFALVDVGTWAVYRDGEGSVVDSVSIAAWATVPWALAFTAFAPLLAYVVVSRSGSPSGSSFQGAVPDMGGLGLLAFALFVGAAVAAWLVCYCGLRGRHRLSDGWATWATIGIAGGGILAAAGLLAA